MTHIKSFSVLTSQGMNEEKQKASPEIKWYAVRLSNKVILIAVKLEKWMLEVWKKKYLPDLWSIIIRALRVWVPIKHDYTVFQWPWQQRSLIELHEQEVLQGQQDVPWLRRRGSKNSRKLLYFVEWAQECKMSAISFFFHFLFWALSRITCWRRQALKIMRPRWMHVWHGAGTRMFAVTHLHIPRRRPEGFTDRNKTLPQQLFGWGTQASSQATEVDGKLVTWKNRSKYAPCNLTGRQLTTKTVIKFSAVSPSDRCRVSEKIKSRNTDQIASMSHLSLAFISWS